MQCLLILKTFIAFAFVLVVDNALNQVRVFVQHLIKQLIGLMHIQSN